MADAGWSGAAAVIGLLAVDLFIPVPSSIVMVLSGAAFGVGWGSLLAFAGSSGGEALGFELARRYGSSWFARFIGDEDERQRLNRILVTHGPAAVAVTRALPVVMETMSVVAGLSTMTRGTFKVWPLTYQRPAGMKTITENLCLYARRCIRPPSLASIIALE